MVAYLSKSNASEGFNQIIDFLNESSIKLQALVDKKKVVVTEATIKEALRLDDAEGVDCLPNEEIFAELDRMGYEKPSTKLTYYKAFFSSQWNSSSGNYKFEKEGEETREEEQGDSVEAQKVEKGKDDAEMDQDGAVVLEDDKEEDREVADDVKDVEEDKDETEPAEVQEVVDVVTTAKLITKVVTAVSETVTAASAIITTAEAQVPAATLTAAPARVTAAPNRRRKGVVIRDPEEESTTTTIIPAETKSKDKDPSVKKYQAMKKKPQTEAQARKNMMMYLKNVAGFKMDYFKRMSYDDIRPIFEAKFNSNREQLRGESWMRRWKNSKDIFKLCLIKMMMFTLKPPYLPEREDLEALWSLVKERFSYTWSNVRETRYTCSDLEESKNCTWSRKGQRMEATRIMWCADHNVYIYSADFVSREEVSAHKIHSRPDVKCCKA
nr:hypothetical protein [Tanacetum cinerariifolium]